MSFGIARDLLTCARLSHHFKAVSLLHAAKDDAWVVAVPAVHNCIENRNLPMLKTLLTVYDASTIDTRLPDEHFLQPVVGSWARRTFLEHAFEVFDPHMVLVLLKAGASPNIVGTRGRTLLMAAAEAGLIDIIKTLLVKGVNVLSKDDAGWDALTYAWKSNRTSAVPLLIAGGADVKSCDLHGLTVAMWASSHGLLDILGMAVGSDPSVLTQVDSKGWTCMHHAAARDQHLVATELVRVAGPRLISMFAADKCGRTPLDLAFNSEVVDFLEDGLAAATLQGSELCIVAPSNSDIEKLQGTTAAPPPTASIRASSPTTSSPSIEAFLKEEFSRLGNTATRMLDSSGSSASASLILRKLDAALTDILSALSKQAAFPETANDYVSMVSEECAVVPNDETIADLPGTFPVSHSQEFDQAPVPDSKIPQMVVTPTEDDDFSDAARVFPPNHGENAPVVRVLDGFIYTKLRVRGLGKLTPEVWTSGMSDSDSANEEDDRESTDLQSPSAASEEDIEVDEYEFV